MLILERSITRENWVPAYRVVTRRHKEGWSRKVAKIDGHTIWNVQAMGRGFRTYYAIFEETEKGPRPIAWLMMFRRRGWAAWEEEQVWVFPSHRGHGLAKKLYLAAINHDRQLVASGKSHSKYSKAMWESFVKKGSFNIWAHDIFHLERNAAVEWDEDEQTIACELNIYTKAKVDGSHRPNSVRLIALRKD